MLRVVPDRSPALPRKPLSTPIQVALLCLCTAAVGAFGNVLVRLMSAELDTLQTAFLRNLFGFVSAALLLPFLAAPGQSVLAGAFAVPWRMWIAAALNLASMFCFFSAVTLMALGDLTAISFASPIWWTIGGAILFRETVTRSRWIATLGGIVGVLVMLRPGLGVISPPALLVLVGTVAYALSSLTVKAASRHQPALVIVLQLSVMMTVVSLIPALTVWRWPSLEVWIYGALVGTMATVGWTTLTRALAMADASSIAPYDFARLPFTIIPAFLMFGEVPDAFAMLGSAIIFAAALYASRQEMKANR